MAKREDAQLYLNVYAHAHVYIKVRACAKREGRGIRRVFMGYTYVSGMCRVCIGYVSGMYRVCIGTYKVRGGCAIKFRADICRFQKKAVPLWGILNRESGSEYRETRVGNPKTGIGSRESGVKNRKLRIKIKNHEKQEN